MLVCIWKSTNKVLHGSSKNYDCNANEFESQLSSTYYHDSNVELCSVMACLKGWKDAPKDIQMHY